MIEEQVRTELVTTKTSASVAKSFMKLFPALFRDIRTPMTIQDRRWKILAETLASFYVQNLHARVQRHVSKIKAKKSNQVSCGKCFWFQQRKEAGDDEVDIGKERYGICTNPVERSQVLAFNPYKCSTKEERNEKAKAYPIWRATSQTCRSSKRQTDVKI